MPLFLFLLLLVVVPAHAQIDPTAYRWTVIADDFDSPIYLTHAGDGSGRLFVVEQLGGIWILGDEYFEPFLDLSNLITQEVFRGGYTEQGLLGLAFHPNYAENGYFYVHYTDLSGNTVVARYSVSADNPDVADPNSAQIVLTVFQPYANHNGGQLAFGPDGYLYIALGDGGDQGDPYEHAQNPASMLGKILRIDVDGGTPYTIPADNPLIGRGAPEVWLLGFRNPWRFSFDRETGDLWIADVGEWLQEEVNFVAAGTPGGLNFGWEYLEGTLVRKDIPAGLELVPPVITYDHMAGCSITGGYVYRGDLLPELQGTYIMGDYCFGRTWTITRDGDAFALNVFMENLGQITSFGEDESGELYLIDYKGVISRLERAE
ncbi:MAG: PQQ-dependent sugar dehydrogenase [Anaerolinea sp.]|nr:PQQ-dependent sugar dehydrogenase [Anaerolinea sp.]